MRLALLCNCRTPPGTRRENLHLSLHGTVRNAEIRQNRMVWARFRTNGVSGVSACSEKNHLDAGIGGITVEVSDSLTNIVNADAQKSYGFAR